MTANGFPSCCSCGCEVTEYRRGCVPYGADCCHRCWSRIPVAERVKIAISLRDREPGGYLNELALALGRVEKSEFDDGE